MTTSQFNVEKSLMQIPVEGLHSRLKKGLEEIDGLSEQCGMNYIETDWEITHLSQLRLPLEFTNAISLSLRDEGNALLDETTRLNNLHVGLRYRYVSVLLTCDLDRLDLESRIRIWALKVGAAFSYKLRNRAKDRPLETFMRMALEHYAFTRKELWGSGSGIRAAVWGGAMKIIGSSILDSLFVQKSLFFYTGNASDSSCRTFLPSGPLAASEEVNGLSECFVTFGLRDRAYMDQMVLSPLLSKLKARPVSGNREAMQIKQRALLADVFEACPYLVEFDRSYSFELDELGVKGYLRLTVGNHGVATISFMELIPLHTGSSQQGIEGTLVIDWDERFYMGGYGPSLESIYGHDDEILITTLLLEKIHDQVVDHYLEVVPSREAGTQIKDIVDSGAEGNTEECATYLSWVKDAQDSVDSIEESDGTDRAAFSHTRLPQLRRSVFFKLLGMCGVRIEQGKGSELKLLKQGKRPFRLGNHGWANPTVPSFLAANILRGLEISSAEWNAALTNL